MQTFRAKGVYIGSLPDGERFFYPTEEYESGNIQTLRKQIKTGISKNLRANDDIRSKNIHGAIMWIERIETSMWNSVSQKEGKLVAFGDITDSERHQAMAYLNR